MDTFGSITMSSLSLPPPGYVTTQSHALCFARRNRLKMIIRAHEVTMDGFDLHSDGHLVTLFSATNYCGVCNNNGAVIEATWGDAHSSGGWTNDRSTLVLQVHLSHFSLSVLSLAPSCCSHVSHCSQAKLISSHVGEDAQKTWVMGRQSAPPTPPRDRPATTTPTGGA